MNVKVFPEEGKTGTEKLKSEAAERSWSNKDDL